MRWPWQRQPGTKAGDRPVGVFIVNRATGAKLPCELTYAGLERDELDGSPFHLWLVATPFNPATETIKVEVLPPRTSIGFPMQLKGGM